MTTPITAAKETKGKVVGETQSLAALLEGKHINYR